MASGQGSAAGPNPKTAPLPPEELQPYLRKYGFQPSDAATWDEQDAPDHSAADELDNAVVGSDASSSSSSPASSCRRPVLTVEVTGHEEKEKHTWYSLQCCLQLPATTKKLEWLVTRRLGQLREELHDPVKLQLSQGIYSQHFGKTPFAHRGGIPGTTARLRSWFAALGDCMNSTADCPPSVVGLTLRFLEAPAPPSLAGSARAAASNVADKMRNKVGFMKAKVSQTSDNMKNSVREAQDSMAESATAASVNFAKQHPEMAKKASATAAGYAKNNPTAAAQATKMAGAQGLGFAAKNPKMAMQFAKITAKSAKTVAKTV